MRLKLPGWTDLDRLTASNGFWRPGLFVLLYGIVAPATANGPGDIRPESRPDDLVVSIEDANAMEGRPVEFTVTLSQERSVPLRVEWELSSETAVAGVDFQPVEGGTLRIPAGATEGTIRIRTLEDRLAEPDDTFEVSLLDVTPIPPDGALVSDESHTATGTILDDDGGFDIPDSELERAIRNELGISSGEAVTVEHLATLTRLLAGTGIQDLTGIQFATNLTSLALFQTDVEDLSPLAHLQGLTSLDMGYGVVRDLSPLRALTGLRELGLNDNAVSDLEPLRGLTRLQGLSLNVNDIADIEPLKGLTNLHLLLLNNNLIVDLEPLAGLTALHTLNLSANAISDVSPLRGLTNLGILELADNSISNVAPLADLSRLWWLDLGRNSIADIEPLLSNHRFAVGKSIFLHDNPLSDEALTTHVPALREAGADVHTVSVSVADASAPEGEALTYAVYLSAPVAEPVDLVWRVNNRTYSTRDVDYMTPVEEFVELTIPSGDTKGEITVLTIGDNLEEVHEPVTVTLWEPTGVSLWADHPGFPTGVTMRNPGNAIGAVGLILEPGRRSGRFRFSVPRVTRSARAWCASSIVTGGIRQPCTSKPSTMPEKAAIP